MWKCWFGRQQSRSQRQALCLYSLSAIFLGQEHASLWLLCGEQTIWSFAAYESYVINVAIFPLVWSFNSGCYARVDNDERASPCESLFLQQYWQASVPSLDLKVLHITQEMTNNELVCTQPVTPVCVADKQYIIITHAFTHARDQIKETRDL